MANRSIDIVLPATRDDVGDLHTHQAIPEQLREKLDPFLLLAHHGPQVYQPSNRGLPFGPHPHRGFETVTFIRAGSLAHHDSGGHESVIEAGGVQWMTAGSGLIHAEVSPSTFRRHGGPIEILQLWVNLPGRLKMSPPRYFGLQASAIPEVTLSGEGARVSLVSGALDAVPGPIESLTGVFMSTVQLEPNSRATLPAPEGRSVLFYVIEGTVDVESGSVGAGHLVTFSHGDGIEVAARAGATLLFGHADPIGEPVVARGPFVMNTDAEIDEAFRDHRAGKFNGTPISLEFVPSQPTKELTI